MGKWEAVSKIQPTNNRLESSSNTINNCEKIRVWRSRQAKKHEEDDDHSGRTIHGSIQPIRLDGLSLNPTIKPEENPSTPAPDGVTEQQEEDIKPILDEFQSTTTTQQPVFFEKQKATTQAQPRQKA
ncbi:hypothetical protein MJO28_004256 [Puccinia striiformis f. sp. tritici]|uniref:Uncharacterized protein n=2 Tax=Puccinia striiformis TaxID=27350 RepID=A0A2S4VBV3_9BASI|nr:hypothetical protein MJO28_004256 [Puccinia striiformis f. sp. tritici]POW06958.1 hypothetical protein PSTT_08641 [Puccinia striiformis]